MKRVLIADDDAELRAALASLLRQAGWEVEETCDGSETVDRVIARPPGVVLLDLEMPGKKGEQALEEIRYLAPQVPVVILTGHGTVERAVQAMKAGAWDFLTKPPDADHLLVVLERARERYTLDAEVRDCRRRREDRYTMAGGRAPAMKDFLELLDRVAATNSTVLFTGETGSGKEVAARYLWQKGPRSSTPFVVVNCAALSDTLLESDFFGHARGAFTGAVSAKRGRLEEADGGTLFLDEVSELSPVIQAKLLRVLEDGTFERVGEATPRRCDVRLIAATNSDLKEEVAAGRFREDLYHRLSVVMLHIPPLRERLEDLEEFVLHHMRLLGVELGFQVPPPSPEIVARLVLSPDGCLHAELLPGPSPPGGTPQAEGAGGIEVGTPMEEAVERFKRDLVRRTLAACEGNQTRAAEVLGMNRSSLNRLLRRLDLR
jgi:DNA-binding NtrC family response regulator